MENVNENQFQVLENFCNNKLDELIQITILERKDKGFGALFLEINSETNNVDCRFVNKQIAYNILVWVIYDNWIKSQTIGCIFVLLVTMILIKRHIKILNDSIKNQLIIRYEVGGLSIQLKGSIKVWIQIFY